MTKLSLVLILWSSSSRGSIGGGGWSSGGSSSSSSGGGWGTSSQNRGNIGGGGWSTGGSSSRGSAGGWNSGGSNSNTGSGKKGGLGSLFGSKKTGSDSSSGGKKGILGSFFGKKKTSNEGFGKKKKGSKLKTLKKAAVIGAVAYGGYKVGQLTSRFSNFGHSNNMGYGFNDWNRWRQQDGFLCRNNNDCVWIDPSLECDDYKLDFSPSNLWFGGDVASIKGKCECRNNFLWNDDDLHCLKRSGGFGGGGGGGLGGLIISIIVIMSMVCCCCVIGCVFIVKMFIGRASEG
ncbi:uncharacterized protein [Lepeophtheirus salmonis]|uniref:uncharacterized protein n=1 Tax=Lepeophtheirus salmonis TaxID=72036 RepID=UPI001AE564E2|nr:uncharacterized transmembrane protein DDB_G0289901-like [Lepeophtheirus salmonis]